MSEHRVIFERADDGGWGAYLLDLPGVVALGSTRDEVAERVREALDAYAAKTSEQRVTGPCPPPGADRH
jgi:predicted RNase H-like HicB family nuclease